MGQIPEIDSIYGKAYDNILEASTAIDSAITFLAILDGQSLSERYRNSAMFGIGTILKAANGMLDGVMNGIEKAKSANSVSGT